MIRKIPNKLSRKRGASFAAATGASILLATSVTYADPVIEYNDYTVPTDETEYVSNLTDDDGITLRKYGNGDLVFSGSNTYTGSTEIYGGSISLGGTAASITQTDTLLIKTGVAHLYFGGTITSGTGRLGVEAGDSGEVLIAGPGAKWTNSRQIYVGESGAGSISVSDGGALQSSQIVSVGVNEGGVGNLYVFGTDSSWESNNLFLGESGEGNMRIWGGGQVTVSGTFLALGVEATGIGYLSISDVGSSLTTTSATRIGVSGQGTFDVVDGASVISSVTEVGSNFGANGLLRVDGAGSSYMMASGALRIGRAGTGAVEVTNGGTFTSSASITLGGSATGVGSILVSGSGSSLSGTAGFFIGDKGEGTVTIENGGLVTSSGSTVLASSAGSTGNLLITGSDSKWVDTGSFTISKGKADLIITDGGLLEANHLIIDGGVDEVNHEDQFNITVSGTGSTLLTSGSFAFLGGQGTINLADGGVLRADAADAGDGTIHFEGGSYTILIGGTGIYSSGGFIEAGEILVEGGALSLNFQHSDNYTFSTNVIDGEDVGTGGTLIQAFAGTTYLTGSSNILGARNAFGGELYVSGSEATLQVKHLGVFEGFFGVFEGATVVATESLHVGAEATAYLWVTGSGSRLNASSLEVQHEAQIWVNDGGLLTTSEPAFVGLNGTNSVYVSGTGSQWIAETSISLGDATLPGGEEIFGQGNLVISDGGIVRIDQNGEGLGTLILSGSNRSNLVIGDSAGWMPYAPGTLEAALVTSGSSGGGAIIFNHTADDYSFLPTITGDIEVNHYAGRTLLATVNDYTGDTLVYGGTLVSGTQGALSENSWLKIIGSTAVYDLNGFGEEAVSVLINEGGSLVNGSLTIDSDAILFDGTLSAVLSGSVGAYKFGDGTVTVENDQLLEGPVRVYQGTLNLVGSIAGNGEVYGGNFVVIGTAGGDLSVSGGNAIVNGIVEGSVSVTGRGVVSGNGFIAQNLFNAGLVSPGNSPGVLTVGGNYSQSSSGTLQIEIASATSYDRLVVNGTASLGGALRIILKGGADEGDRYEIITAGGGVSGEFSEIDDGSNTLRGFEATYLSNSVVIEYTEESFASFAKAENLSPNVRSIAKALDRANAKGKLGSLLDTLYSTDLSQLPNQLSLLSPEDFAQLYRIGFATAQVQFVNLERRLSDVRNGAIGFSANGLALSNSRGTLNYDGQPIMNERDGLSLAGFDGKSIVNKNVAPIIEQSRWGFFATGVGEWADVESTSNARGSEFTTGGFTIGADYRVSDSFVVGIAGGYAHTGSDLNNGGSIGVNSGRGTAYASWFTGGAYVNATVGGAYNSYETKRGTIGGKARGDTNGGEFNTLLGGGYDWRVGGFAVGPIGSLQYTYIGVSGFQETGSSAPLNFASQSQDSLKSLLGLKASYAWNVGGIVITPEVRAQWSHEYLDSTVAVESGFVGGAGVFTVTSPNIGRDGLLLDAGASVQFSPAVSVFAYYTGELGRTNYSSNSVNGGFRIAF